MFVAPVCFMYFIKLTWPKSKNIYDAYHLKTLFHFKTKSVLSIY